MRKEWIRWGTGICIGLCLGAVGYWILYPLHFSPLAREARLRGYEPASYIAVHDLAKQAAKQKSLSADQLENVKRLTEDKNPFIRVRALTALFYLGNSKEASAAAEIARRKLNDANPLVRSYALRALGELKTEDAATQAQRMSLDPDEKVQRAAAKILAGQ
jgi:HEAT repeat protein